MGLAPRLPLVCNKYEVLTEYWDLSCLCDIQRAPLRGAEFVDNTERRNEVKKEKQMRESCRRARDGSAVREGQFHEAEKRSREITKDEAKNGGRRMPRLPEAMKDAASCENARGAASGLRYARVRMGQPGRQAAGHRLRAGANAGNRNIPVPAGGERKDRWPE